MMSPLVAVQLLAEQDDGKTVITSGGYHYLHLSGELKLAYPVGEDPPEIEERKLLALVAETLDRIGVSVIQGGDVHLGQLLDNGHQTINFQPQ